MTKAEYIERYGEEAYKKKLEYQKAYRETNKDKVLEYWRSYRETNKDKVAECNKKYREANKEKITEQCKVYREANRDRINERMKEYRNTKNGRASNLLGGYKRTDKELNRGECTLTVEWIIENIFSGQVCHWCSESDWKKLGCDRINNDLPHTPENVVCSCEDCNINRGSKTYDEYRRLLNMKIA